MASKELILDAAVEMIAEAGYNGLSMRDVARRVGISHPGVMYHFPSKSALLMAVVRRYEENANFVVDEMEGLSPFDVFQSFVELANQLGKHHTIAEMECMLAVEAASAVHPAHDHFATRFEELSKALTKAFADLDERGWLVSSSTPRDLGQSLLAQWYGLQIQWLYHPEMVDVADMLTRAVIGYVDIFKDDVVKEILQSSFSSPVTLAAMQHVFGISLSSLLQKHYSAINFSHMDRYGLEEVPHEIIKDIVKSGVVTSDDLHYLEDHKAFSIDLLGRLVVGRVLSKDQYDVLSGLGVVSADAVAALAAVMRASNPHSQD